MPNHHYPFVFRAAAGLLFIVLVVLVLYFASGVLTLLGFAVLLSYLLYPLTNWMEGKKIPRGVANIVAIVLLLGVIVSTAFILYKQVGRIMVDFPSLKEHALANISQMEAYLEEKLPFVPHDRENWLTESVSGFLASGESTLKNTFAATASTLGKAFLLPFFIFFMLYYRERLRDFILDMVPPEKHDLTDQVLLKISTVTTRYMVGILIVTVILSTLMSCGLLIIGLKYALLLGVIAGLFNLIPYFGTVIGGTIPLAMSLLVMDSPKYALFVIILILILQFLEHNILTPNITGSRVRLNPLFTLISILSGALLWGLAGMFLAIPFVGMFKIVCEHVDQLKPVARLIGTDESNGLGGKVQEITKRWVEKLRGK